MQIVFKKVRKNSRRRSRQALRPAVAFLVIFAGLFHACRILPEPVEAPLLTIAAVGDTYARSEWFSRADPLEDVRSLLNEEELFIFNMEGALLSRDPSPGVCRDFPNQSLFWSRSSIADFLHPTRLTIATLGNNHILDCGDLGIRETRDELARRSILSVGAGEDADSACRPLTLEPNGVRLAVLSYLSMNPDLFAAGPNQAGTASWDTCSAESSIAALSAASDLVIVVLHLHLAQGWTDRTPPEHLTLAEKALDAGADIVIVHGPHVPQGILVREGGVAFLSLGNFLFRPMHTMPPQAHDSLMVKISVLPHRFEVSLLPLLLDVRGRPVVPTDKEATWMLRRWADLSAGLGAKIEIRERVGRITVFR